MPLSLLDKPGGRPVRVTPAGAVLLAGMPGDAATPAPGAGTAPDGALVLPDAAPLVLPGDAPLALPA